MSLNGLFNTQFPLTIDGTTSLDASSITIDGQNVNLTGLVPYTGANQTVDLGSQIIKTTHTATTNPELVNLGLLNTTISNLSIAIAGSFLDKVTLSSQTVIGPVTYTNTLTADDFVVPATKKANLGGGTVEVDVNYQQSTNDASVTANQYFGAITSSLGIYQSTSTQDMGVLGLGPVLTVGQRYRVIINALINDPNPTILTLYASSNGTAFNQVLQSIGFNPNSTIFQVYDHTFVAAFPYVIFGCLTSGPFVGATVQWFGLQRYEVGVELERVTLPLLTASKVPIINSRKQLVSSGTDASKLDYLDNVGSDIQTQLNNKLNLSGNNANQDIILGGYKVQSTANPTVADDLTRKGYVDSITSNLLTSNNTWTGINTFSLGASPIVLSGLTGNRLLGLGVAKDIQTINATLLEGSYLAGVTSGIQGQLDGKGNLATTNTWTSTNTFSAVNPINLSFLSGQRALILDASKNIQVSATTSTELGYVSGVTSGIQGQLDGKVAKAGDTMTGQLQISTTGFAPLMLTRTSAGANYGVGTIHSLIGTLGFQGYYARAFGGSNGAVATTAQSQANGYYSIDVANAGVFGSDTSPDNSTVYITSSSAKFKPDINALANLYASGKVGIGTDAPSAPLHIKASGGGNPAANGLYVYNPTNTAGQDAIVSVRVAGSSGGNPYVSFDVNGEAGWAWGMDNNGNSMKLASRWDTLTTDTKLTIDTSGNLTATGYVSSTGLQCNGTAETQNLVITYGYNINVSNGNGTDGQILFGYSGSQSEYRHRITTGHDGSGGPTGVFNYMDFFLWSNLDVPKAVGTNHRLRIAGHATIVYGAPLNVAGTNPYAVPQGFSNQAGQLVIGGIDQNYVGGWSSGFLMECQDQTEFAVHDRDTRLASFMYYNANTFTIGRDTGWGVSDTNINGNLQCNGGTIVFPNRGDCRIYNGSADAYTPTSTANNLIIKSWWGIGYESYDGAVRIAMNTRDGSGYYAGSVGIGTTSPSGPLHVYGNTNGALVSYVQNASAGSSAYALFACINNTGSGLVLFQNSTGRTADGGGSTGTLRNDAGDLRLQSAGGVGLTVNVGGSVSHSAGDASITAYGPNTTWGAYLRVGAGGNGAGAVVAQVISTNGNLHLDGGYGKDIYIGYYPWSAGGGNPNNIYSYSRDTWTHTGNFNVTGNTTISLTNPAQTTWNSTDNRLLFRDTTTGIVRSGACSTWFYINGGIAWTYGVNVDYAFYVPNTTCSIQINVTGSGYSGNVIGTYILVRAYQMGTGTYYDNTKPYFFNVTYNHTEITAHFTIPNNAWGAQTIGWKRVEFYWYYNSGGSISSDSNDTLNWTALVIG